jgi:hypothetical protein
MKDDVAVDGMSVGFQGRTMAIDTTTRLSFTLNTNNPAYFYMNFLDAQDFHAALYDNYTTDGLGNFQVVCSLKAIVTVVLGGVAFTFSPLDYIGEVTSKDAQGNIWCETNIIGAALVPYWIAGTCFLKNVSIPKYEN